MWLKYRWFFAAFVAVVVGTAGLMLGKAKEKDFLARLYARSDFTLLDDKNNFFQLSKFPSSRLLLLIFTPDSLNPAFVADFRRLGRYIDEFKALGIDLMMITRTNREIARNFKEAAKFPTPLLIDNSGTVGRNIGVWEDARPVNFWAYALLDNQMQVYWATSDTKPKSYEELLRELKKLAAEAHGHATSPSRPTSSAVP